MRCFIITDVHSYYDEMISALNKKGFDKNNPKHVLISLGDLLDRGPDPIKCLEYVLSCPRKVLIRGNHEDLMQEAIKRKCFLSHDVHNGTFDTAQIVSGIKYDPETNNQEIILEDFSKNKLWNDYYNQTIDFAETDKYIFVHGWIPLEDDWRNGDWSGARWANGMYQNYIGLNIPGKTVYCGHYHASWGHSKLNNDGPEWDDDVEIYENLFGQKIPHAKFTPFKIKGEICALDACTALSGFCNCEVVTVRKDEVEKYI